jgi:Homogentisate 1,2-dioxygenase
MAQPNRWRSTRMKIRNFSEGRPALDSGDDGASSLRCRGWDGYVYPFTFNAQDFEPITGTVHQPPPIHQTFEIRGYVVCTFAPRLLDTHPEAVRIPWVHDNVEADEVLFYVRGNFGSRRGIEPASITLHPRGIPHGPHPGTIMASKNATRTEELAVMFDTQHTLELTEQAVALDDEISEELAGLVAGSDSWAAVDLTLTGSPSLVKRRTRDRRSLRERVLTLS